MRSQAAKHAAAQFSEFVVDIVFIQERGGTLIYASKNGESLPTHDQSRNCILQVLALAMELGEPGMVSHTVARHLSRPNECLCKSHGSGISVKKAVCASDLWDL